jgi:hypothetical protein
VLQLVRRVVVAIGLGLVIAAVPGVAQATTTAEFGPTATLVADGVGIDVTVIYTCPADGTVADIDVSVTQNVRGLLTSGIGREAPTCDDVQHTATVRVFASVNDGRAFSKGVTYAQGNLAPCVFCFGGPTFSATIDVRKK